MAVQQTQALPPQYVEDLQKDYGTQLTGLTATPLQTSAFAPQIAPQDQYQQDAYTLAGQGIGAYQPYINKMSLMQLWMNMMFKHKKVYQE